MVAQPSYLESGTGCWLVADPADLAAQHRVLVPEHQQFGILGHLTPG